MQKNSILIKNARIVNEGSITNGDLLIEGKKISIIDSSISVKNNITKVIDADGKFLMPGMIDDQVHFREPGLTHKGDIFTESRAAVAGGVTSFIEMPNTIPNTINELRSAMKKVVNKSSDNLKLKLLRAHPELGIKKNQLSSLTESSQEEQKSVGLDQCSEEEYEEIKSLNKSYKEKFQFPFIISFTCGSN